MTVPKGSPFNHIMSGRKGNKTVDIIKIAVMVLLGGITGYLVPSLAQQLIDYKGKQKNKEMPRQPGYLSVVCRLVCAAASAGGLGLCGYLNPSWVLLLMAGVIWILGMVILLVDMRIRIIANETILALFVLGIVFRLLTAGFRGIPNSLLTMLVITVIWIFLARIMGLGSVGAGDVKLCGVMGFLYGFPGVDGPILVMAAGLLAFCGAGLLFGKVNRYTMFPMGPFLIVGMLSGLPYVFYRM